MKDTVQRVLLPFKSTDVESLVIISGANVMAKAIVSFALNKAHSSRFRCTVSLERPCGTLRFRKAICSQKLIKTD